MEVPPSIIDHLLSLLHTDLVRLAEFFWKQVKRFQHDHEPHGMYEALSHEVQLELLDTSGKKAIHTKLQHVRFLQDTVAYLDMAWGDGNIFVSYQCSPGIPVDRYQEGHRQYTLISLRETKHRGDMADIHIQRTIRQGFTQPTEHFQNIVIQSTQQMSISVIFPQKRLPQSITFIEQNAKRMSSASASHKSFLPDGRLKVTWEKAKPRLFEGYIIRWAW
jgi:hypothetical protein